MYNFGAGRAYLTPAVGSGSGQPLELGVIQSATLELKVDLKELRASPRFPIAVADGKGTCSGKINFMQIWPEVIAAIVGNGAGVGFGPGNAKTAIIGERGTIPALTPFTYSLAQTTGGTPPYTFVPGSEIVVVTLPNGNPVYYMRGASGGELSANNAGVANGVYSIAGSVLTFSSFDAGFTITVSYIVQATASNAQNVNNYSVTLQKLSMNSAPTFSMMLVGIGRNVYTNAQQQMLVELKTCIAPGLKWNFKLDDFTDLEFDYSAYIDVNGVLGSFYFINP